MYMTVISLQGIRKTFPGMNTPVLQGICLEVFPGEILSLLGPSGCGKTTTLRIMAGFERPDDGNVFIAGKPVADGKGMCLPPEKRGLGMVFQDYALFPHLTVEDNVAFGLRTLSSSDKRARVEDMLELVGLAGMEKRYPYELSGGQQQRVALARALAPAPPLILMDEPFSNLDASLRESMRSEVRNIIRKAGATAVIVTHDQKDALAIAERIAVMRDGRIEQLGTAQEIYGCPATPFVAAFIGGGTVIFGQWVNPDQIKTPFGLIQAGSSLGSRDETVSGQDVRIVLRPESFIPDDEGRLLAKLLEVEYAGSRWEAIVEFQTTQGEPLKFHVHLPPWKMWQVGQEVRLSLASQGMNYMFEG